MLGSPVQNKRHINIKRGGGGSCVRGAEIVMGDEN